MSSYVEGVAILLGLNIIAVLGVSILTGFTRLFLLEMRALWPSEHMVRQS